MTYPRKWETMDARVQRLKTPNGWIITTDTDGTCYVPDSGHAWPASTQPEVITGNWVRYRTPGGWLVLFADVDPVYVADGANPPAWVLDAVVAPAPTPAPAPAPTSPSLTPFAENMKLDPATGIYRSPSAPWRAASLQYQTPRKYGQLVVIDFRRRGVVATDHLNIKTMREWLRLGVQPNWWLGQEPKENWKQFDVEPKNNPDVTAGAWIFPTANWRREVYTLKMNSGPGVGDGSIKVEIDGLPVFSKSGFAFDFADVPGLPTVTCLQMVNATQDWTAADWFEVDGSSVKIAVA
jgi:hypothetical protein